VPKEIKDMPNHENNCLVIEAFPGDASKNYYICSDASE